MSDIKRYQLAELTCARAECLAEPERDHTGGYRPLCGTCRHWPRKNGGAERPLDDVLRGNEKRTKRLAGPPTVKSLQKDIDDTLRVRARWSPEFHREMARRYEIDNQRDGYSSGSRVHVNVVGGDTADPTNAAVLARDEDRQDHDDPQAPALQATADCLRLLEVAAHQIEESHWSTHLQFDGLGVGHWLRTEPDPRMVELLAVIPTTPQMKANRRLKWLWDLGDAGAGKSFRVFVQGVRASGKLARQIEFQILAIEKATGRKI